MPFYFILHSTCFSVGWIKNVWISNMTNIHMIADGTIKGHKRHISRITGIYIVLVNAYED